MQTDSINMKLNFEGMGSAPWVDLGRGQEAEIQLFFQNMAMLHIKLKRMAHAASWYNLLPIDHLPPPL